MDVAHPGGVAGGAEGCQACRDGGAGLDRLLVKLSHGVTAWIKALRADRPEMSLRGSLQFHQPAERAQADVEGALIARAAAADDQGLAQARVVVGENILKPWPGVVGMAVEEFEQP